MTITEMRKYLQLLENDGWGENIMRIQITDSGKHGNYGCSAEFLKSWTFNSESRTSLYFGLCESTTGINYKDSENAVTRPVITFRKK